MAPPVWRMHLCEDRPHHNHHRHHHHHHHHHYRLAPVLKDTPVEKNVKAHNSVNLRNPHHLWCIWIKKQKDDRVCLPLYFVTQQRPFTPSLSLQWDVNTGFWTFTVKALCFFYALLFIFKHWHLPLHLNCPLPPPLPLQKSVLPPDLQNTTDVLSCVTSLRCPAILISQMSIHNHTLYLRNTREENRNQNGNL